MLYCMDQAELYCMDQAEFENKTCKIPTSVKYILHLHIMLGKAFCTLSFVFCSTQPVCLVGHLEILFVYSYADKIIAQPFIEFSEIQILHTSFCLLFYACILKVILAANTEIEQYLNSFLLEGIKRLVPSLPLDPSTK